MRKESDKIFLLTWKGSRVPSGAKVDGAEIAWTQHGVVTSVEGKMIGSYDRIVDSHGGTNEENAMMVYLWPKKAN